MRTFELNRIYYLVSRRFCKNALSTIGVVTFAALFWQIQNDRWDQLWLFFAIYLLVTWGITCARQPKNFSVDENNCLILRLYLKKTYSSVRGHRFSKKTLTTVTAIRKIEYCTKRNNAAFDEADAAANIRVHGNVVPHDMDGEVLHDVMLPVAVDICGVKNFSSVLSQLRAASPDASFEQVKWI